MVFLYIKQPHTKLSSNKRLINIMAVELEDLLEFTVENNAANLHLSSGLPPMIRLDGEMRRLSAAALSSSQILKMIYGIMNDRQRRILDEDSDMDFSYDVDGLARFRVNAFQQMRGTSTAFRTIPSKISTLDDIQALTIFRH